MSVFGPDSTNWALFLPSTPKRPCLPQHPSSDVIPLSFSSPPPSNPQGQFRESSCTPGNNTTLCHQPLSSFPARLLELTPDPFMSPDHRGGGPPGHQQHPYHRARHQSSSSKKSSSGGVAGSSCGDSGKRGRPRADVISNLMMEGSSSPSEIKCNICHRVFPREKSLQAHLRTHTGEKPYICDYPGCSRAFTQSGQLKTHQRLHAGEKPFICSAPGCSNRYTHANRTCPAHPYHKPHRSTDLILQPILSGGSGENGHEVQVWLENYRRERMDKTPGKQEPIQQQQQQQQQQLLPLLPQQQATKPKSKRGLVSVLEQENMPQEQHDREQQLQLQLHKRSLLEERLALSSSVPSALTLLKSSSPSSSFSSSPRKTLGDITRANVPKKRWLKEAYLQQQKQQEMLLGVVAATGGNNEVLARPIQWGEEDDDEEDDEDRQQRRHEEHLHRHHQNHLRRSPKSLIVATALVELGEDKLEQSQPLNLSLSRAFKC